MKKPRSEDARLSFELEGPDWWILVGLVEKGVSTPLKGPGTDPKARTSPTQPT